MTQDHQEKQKALHAAYRITFFDGPYGLMVFEDLMEKSGLFDDLFANGDRPSPGTDNAYLQGRRSMVTEMLELMGITGDGQIKRVAEALSTVLPAGVEKQEEAES